VADLEADGDVDIVMSSSAGLAALVNDGTARFTDESSLRMPAVYTFAYTRGDFDRDGDVDFTVGVQNGARLLVNNGLGVFSDTTTLPFAGELAVDVDRDLDLDLVLPGVADVGLNDGTGRFFDRRAAERRGPDFAGRPGRAALADVDRDGDVDVWLTNSEAAVDRLLLNDGRGGFADAPQPLPPSGITSVVVFGDVDADGDQDAGGGYVGPASSDKAVAGQWRGRVHRRDRCPDARDRRAYFRPRVRRLRPRRRPRSGAGQLRLGTERSDAERRCRQVCRCASGQLPDRRTPQPGCGRARRRWRWRS
jgi:hypothetical protein